MVVIGQKWLYSVKSDYSPVKLLCSGKSGCILGKWLYFFQSGFIRAKVFVFGQKLYWSKVVVFEPKWVYLCKVVLFGKNGSILAK